MRLFLLLCILLGSVAGLYVTAPGLFNSFAWTSDDIVEDSAQIFAEDEVNYIHEYHAMLLDRFDFDYRVVTVNGQQDINMYAAKLFKDLNIGERSQSSRGLLLLIDVENDQVRLEVSANLESVYTDSFMAYLEQRQMVPFFKVNRVADGIFATAEIIRIRALDAEKGEEFDLAKIMGSIGGGAKTKAKIGTGKETHFQQGDDVLAADDPQVTLQRYINALANRNGRSDLDVFTAESRKFMAGMLSTPAQMDNAVKRLKGCEIEHLTYNQEETRAVLFHSLNQRQCDPFFFEKGEDGKWRLDLKTLGLGTNHTFGNIWYIHFGRYEESEIWRYNFGMQQVYFHRPSGENGRFDHQGIPYYYKYGVNLNHVGGDMKITKVVKGGFMDRIGIQAGDQIVEWEGVKFLHTNQLAWRLDHVRPGLDIRMVIRRGDKRFSKVVQAPPYPKKGQLRFGFSFRSPSPILQGRPVKLAMVHYVEPGQQGDKLGLQVGDLIAKWQDKQLPTMDDIHKIMKQTQPGTPLHVEIYRDNKKITLTSITEPLRKMGKVH